MFKTSSHTEGLQKEKEVCSIRGCNEYHHETLHPESETAAPVPVMTTNLSSAGDRTSVCLLQVMGVQAGGKDEVMLNIMWDGGATISLITKNKAAELGLEGSPCQLSVVGVGCVKKQIPSKKYVLPLRDLKGETEEITVYEIDKISTPISPINTACVPEIQNIRRPAGEVDVLIGYEYAGFHPVPSVQLGHLLILENKFGKCIGGSHPKLTEMTKYRYRQIMHVNAKEVTLVDFFNMESLGVQCTGSFQDVETAHWVGRTTP